MRVKTRVYNYLSSMPGHRCTMNQVERGIMSSTSQVKAALRELVGEGKATKHWPTAGGLTHWSVELDTRPETRALSAMVYPGAIFTPPLRDNSTTAPLYHQTNERHWLAPSERNEPEEMPGER